MKPSEELQTTYGTGDISMKIATRLALLLLALTCLVSAASVANAKAPRESIDVYWSMRSPYCYIALDRLLQLREEYDVDLNLKVVWPIAIKDPEFFIGISKYMEYRVPYQDLDTARSAAFAGVAYQYPNPDPVRQAPNFGPVLPMEKQDLIKMITHAAIYATGQGKGWEYLDQVSHMMWNGSVPKDWHKGDHVKNAIDRTGLDGAKVLQEIAKNPAKYDAIIDEHQKGQNEAGFGGVPLMTLRGENFFGQDRIDQLLWRMEQYRVPKRKAE
jgi:2-hydroxychromene-2-carboxylate isomerase